MMRGGRTRESTFGTYYQSLNRKRAQIAEAEVRYVEMYLLSGTLLRLSSVKAGMMVGMIREKKKEKRGGVEEGLRGLNGYMVLLPRSC